MFYVEMLDVDGKPSGKYAGDRDSIPNGVLAPNVNLDQAYKFSDKESGERFEQFMRTHYEKDFVVAGDEVEVLPKVTEFPPMPKCKPPKLEANEIGVMIIDYLNELKDINSITITKLVRRVAKVGKLEDASGFVNHPHVMCGMSDDDVVVGMLGIVNGICSLLGCGTIAAVYDNNKVNEFVWLEKKNEK